MHLGDLGAVGIADVIEILDATGEHGLWIRLPDELSGGGHWHVDINVVGDEGFAGLGSWWPLFVDDLIDLVALIDSALAMPDAQVGFEELEYFQVWLTGADADAYSVWVYLEGLMTSAAVECSFTTDASSLARAAASARTILERLGNGAPN